MVLESGRLWRSLLVLRPGCFTFLDFPIQVLSISGNRLRSLGPIAECLTLQEVNLAANKPVPRDFFHLSSSFIFLLRLDEAALAPLAALPALKLLNISRNNIRDLSPLILAGTRDIL